MNKFLKILLIVLIIAAVVGIGFLGYGYYQKLNKKVQNPVATIEVENFGTIKVELYPDMAPNTVVNFIALANNGFYDGLTFHRTIPDFMIQGGDPNGDGTGSPTLSDIKDGGSDTETYTIEGEFIANGYNENTLKFKRGVIAMARSDYSSLSTSLTTQGYNSAGSQFFIMTADNDNLNGLYAGFGEVIEGMDVVDQIVNVEVVTRDQSAEEGVDKPVEPPVITSIRVETYGVDYGEPET
ncbi:MAG: peptidylprolyl isomerase, partial [Clostridia bacterium]